MKPRASPAIVLLLVLFFVSATGKADTAMYTLTAPAFHTQLVGHEPLYHRGMNAALAVYDHYVYIGNRTDASSTCVGPSGVPAQQGCPHPHPGILIVDVKDPAHPQVVGEIGKPHAGLVGITTRELRVWPQQKLLLVMNFHCSTVLHACAKGTDLQFPFDISFFDLSEPLAPLFIGSYVPTSKAGRAVKPHEMFLWIDPKNADRALLYLSTPTTTADIAVPNMIVADISHVRQTKTATEIAEGNWNGLYPGTHQPDYPYVSRTRQKCGPYDCNLYVHSMGVSVDGARAYLALEAGHFLVLNTESVAHDASQGVLSLNGDLLTSPLHRPVWGQTPDAPSAVPAQCKHACAASHSAVKVPGRQLVLTTDEVYGTYTDPNQGCPWGWARLIDVSDESRPTIVSEFKMELDKESFCSGYGKNAGLEKFTSFSSHNPTVLPHLALMSWHSGGLEIADISDAVHPVRAGWFIPSSQEAVATEDPALSRGSSKIVFWSYPIIRNGLIYVVDIRNGLYILRYTGAHADEVHKVGFLEGNSNLGDAARLEQASAP